MFNECPHGNKLTECAICFDQVKHFQEALRAGEVAQIEQISREMREDHGRMVVINLHIDPSILAAIDEAARREGRTRAAWIREACERNLEHEPA